jgi:transcriptional regulator with XRE-family HTH domain
MPVRYQSQREAHKHFIREWRASRGLSLTQLAELTDMSVASLSRLELGRQSYTQPVLENLAHALGCEPADLIARQPESFDQEILELVRKLPEREKLRVISIIRTFTDS